jgi:hypothetical protein
MAHYRAAVAEAVGFFQIKAGCMRTSDRHRLSILVLDGVSASAANEVP